MSKIFHFMMYPHLISLKLYCSILLGIYFISNQNHWPQFCLLSLHNPGSEVDVLFFLLKFVMNVL